MKTPESVIECSITSTAANLRVVLSISGKTEWRGTFAQFVEDNRDGLTMLEIQRAADAMERGDRFTFGGGSAPWFSLDRETSVEDFFHGLREWVPLLPGFGVRMLLADDIIRYGDFQLSHDGRGLYAGRGTIGHAGARSWHGDKYVTNYFRYTRQLFTDEPSIAAYSGEDDVVSALRDQVSALARAEREAFGAAVTAYREANEADTAPERLAELRMTCDRLMGEMKFETRGLWWDAERGAWGLGEAPWRDDEDSTGAFHSGPHY